MKITKTLIKNLIDEKNGIAKLVLQDMFDKADWSGQAQKEFQEAFIMSFNDLLTYGTNNGSISRLVYYADDFYDENYNEIEELRKDREESTGEPLQIEGDLKDFFARFAYEETARRLMSEFENE